MDFRPLHGRVVARDAGRRHGKTSPRPFSFPHEVVEDPSLSRAEKSAILAEWASDACAVESLPTLRWLPGTSFPVTFSAVMDARQWLDRNSPLDVGEDQERARANVILASFGRRDSSSGGGRPMDG